MKGKYEFEVRSKKVVFRFEIKRNITVIKGDSASGKTTLLNMMYEYLLNGRESGLTVSTNAKYYVYLRDMPGRSWQETFEPLKNTVIFIEENNNFIFSREFAEYVLSSGNYFVFISRSPLKMLPYSIHEIYEIKTRKKQADVRQVFCDFQELYSNFPDVKNNRMSVVVTEDSNSGYEFYSALFEKMR